MKNVSQRKIYRKYVNIGVIISTQDINIGLMWYSKTIFEKVKLSPQIDRIALMILTMTSFHHPQRPVSLQDKSMPVEYPIFK